MSNDSVANVDITPTASQQIFTTTNNLTLSNSCSQGATISISTNSTTSNDLTRNGSDSATKTIPATTGSSLLDNTWGFSTDGGTTYNPVPMKGGTATYVYDAVEAATNKNIPVQFGIKADSSLPSGTYTTDVVYTAAVKSGCLTYSLAWDLNGGTGKSGTSYATTNVNWGTTFDLTNYTPTRDGYTFTGWSNGSSTFTGSETSAELNIIPNNSSITMVAQWQALCASGVASETINLNANASQSFSYTGAAKCLLFAKDGNYKVELWGAKGGYSSGYNNSGGNGGYVKGEISLTKNTPLYLYIGQAPGGTPMTSVFNALVSDRSVGKGGGSTDLRYFGDAVPTSSDVTWHSSLGLNSRIIVAAGGGSYYAGAAGGLSGYAGGCTRNGSGGTQTSIGSSTSTGNPGSFGIAGGGCSGGGGYYGGNGGADCGGGGSSYISGHAGSIAIKKDSTSNPRAIKDGCSSSSTSVDCSKHYSGLYFTNTVMVDGSGYNWTTAKGSKTNMPNTAGSGTEAGHAGSGYAKITYLGN